MKKNILLLSLYTLLVLSFTGCGASGDSQNPTEAAGPIAPVIAESLAPTECPESGAEDDLAIAIGSEALCDLGSVRFSLSLPETWDYEIRNVTTSEMTTDAIVFWNIAYPEDTFTLVYAPAPGICGTGVTSEKITLPDRAKVLDLHYPVRSRHPFAGKYPAAGIHTSVSRLVYSGIGFQPYL